MGWRMIGKPILTADNSSTKPAVSQRFQIPTTRADSFLEGIGAGIVLYNDPAFTAVRAELWSDDNNTPGVLISQSQTQWLKADLLVTQIHAYKLAGFKFSPVALKKGNFYRIALRMTGYIGTDLSHIAWRHSYPDPQYRTGLTLNAAKGAKHPFELSIFAAEA